MEALDCIEDSAVDGARVVFVLVVVLVVEGSVVCLSSWSRITSMISIALYFDLPKRQKPELIYLY